MRTYNRGDVVTKRGRWTVKFTPVDEDDATPFGLYDEDGCEVESYETWAQAAVAAAEADYGDQLDDLQEKLDTLRSDIADEMDRCTDVETLKQVQALLGRQNG